MQLNGNLKKAVFLDRDGVINHVILKRGLVASPRTVNELRIISGVIEAISDLNNAQFELVVITNQPEVSRGTLSMENLIEMHQEITRQTGLSQFYICTHDDKDECSCRKPKPGLILEAAEKLNIDPQKSFLVGDRWKDIKAGQAAGCQCFFVDYNYHEVQPSPPFRVVASLQEASSLILEN